MAPDSETLLDKSAGKDVVVEFPAGTLPYPYDKAKRDTLFKDPQGHHRLVVPAYEGNWGIRNFYLEDTTADIFQKVKKPE